MSETRVRADDSAGALDEALAALRQSERRFKLLVESVAEYAITILDDAGRVVSWNAGAARIFGCGEQEIVGRHFSTFYTTGDIVEGKPVRDLAQASVEGQLREQGPRVRADGTAFWAEVATTVLRDGEGWPEGFAIVTHDITDRRRAEAEREELLAREQRARAEAEAASRAKNEFISTLSHELRTPLTAILGWARMLRTRQADPAFVLRAVEVIERGARVQAKLVEELLDISRIEQGKLHLNVHTIDLGPLLGGALDAVRPAAEAKELTLVKAVDPRVQVLSADPDRLQQILSNLLSNAVKFTPARGRVELTVALTDDRVQLVVSDSGPGIAPEFLPYVFDRFRQADSSATRRAGGLGIGLAIVRHLVEMHGGTVEAESGGLGRGSRFVVTLPLPGVSAVRAPPKAAAGSATGARPLHGLRVLLVEDEPDARELLVQVIAHAGADVTACATVGEAMAELERRAPDVLVSDIGLPDEDGYELIARVRARAVERGGQLPAVALTGFAGPRDRARLLVAGFQMHVPKPTEPDELAAAIVAVVSRPRAVKELGGDGVTDGAGRHRPPDGAAARPSDGV